MNFPTVMVHYTEAGKITLSQSRYLQDYSAADPGKYVSPFGSVKVYSKHRESYMSGDALFNDLGKRDKMRGFIAFWQ